MITAYVGPHVRFAAQSAERAWYLRLTQQLIAIGKRRELTVALDDAYLGALAAACPWMSNEGIHRRFYMMRLVLAGGLIDVKAAVAERRFLRVDCPCTVVQHRGIGIKPLGGIEIGRDHQH